MKVSELMSRNVQLTSPATTLDAAARSMAESDFGALPVGENDRLIGMITDRDIVVRGIAAGHDPASTSVREVMSSSIKYCFEDEDVHHVADIMGELQVRRLPVVNHDKRLVGIISLGDISRQAEPHVSGSALGNVSRPNAGGEQIAH